MKKPKEKHERTHDEIQQLLLDHYNDSPGAMSVEWVYLPEVRNQPGLSRGKRTVDGWAVNCYPSNDFRTLAFEIKTEPSDMKSELKDSGKRKEFYDKCHEFWFVVPWGMVEPSEVPEKCGLMYVDASGNIVRKKQAQHRDQRELPMSFVASLVRGQYQRLKGDYNELRDKISDWAVELDGEAIGYEDFIDHVEDLAEQTHYYTRRYELRQELYESEELTYQEVIKPIRNFLEERGHSSHNIPRVRNNDEAEQKAFELMQMVRDEIDRDGLARDELQTIKEARDDLDEIIDDAEEK